MQVIEYTFGMVETAVLLLGYKRTENIASRLLELSKNLEVPIVISIDGGISRSEKQEILNDVASFEKSHGRKVQDTIFRPKNLGLAQHLQIAVSEVLANFNYCIIIEDDVSIAPNFVSTLQQSSKIFERKEILTIGGFSPFIPYTNIRVSRNFFRESNYFSAWGWMISKEKWAEYELQLPKFQIESALSTSVTWKKLSKNQKKIWLRRFSKVANKNPRTWDCQMQFLSFKKDLLNVLPTYQICDNLGFNDIRSTHTKERRPKWMKNPGQLRSETLSIDKIITIETKTGKFLNYLDSVFISGDARIVTIRNFISKLRKIRL